MKKVDGAVLMCGEKSCLNCALVFKGKETGSRLAKFTTTIKYRLVCINFCFFSFSKKLDEALVYSNMYSLS